MDKTLSNMLGIEYTTGEEAFLDNAKGVVLGLMPADTPLAVRVLVSMIVVEMNDFVEKNYTYNGGRE